MKSFSLIIAVIIGITSLSYSQKNIDQVFRKYKNDQGVVNMNFTGEILNIINKADSKLKTSIENVDILIFENKIDVSKSDKGKIDDVLAREKYDLLIDIKNTDQKVKLYALDKGPYLSKVYAHVMSTDMNAYFILSGKIIFEELAKMNLDFSKGDALNLIKGIQKH